VLLTVIVNMVVKPVGQNGWFWGMLVVMVLGIAAVLASYMRSTQQVAAPATK
jgi:F0F1-type ATP synthase assembly protein I